MQKVLLALQKEDSLIIDLVFGAMDLDLNEINRDYSRGFYLNSIHNVLLQSFLITVGKSNSKLRSVAAIYSLLENKHLLVSSLIEDLTVEEIVIVIDETTKINGWRKTKDCLIKIFTFGQIHKFVRKMDSWLLGCDVDSPVFVTDEQIGKVQMYLALLFPINNPINNETHLI